MSTLTGQYISQSYGGIIQLSTNTGIVTGSNTQLQDGFGTNLGVWLNGQGRISGSAVTSSGDIQVNSVKIGRGTSSSNTENYLITSRVVGGSGAGLTALGFNALINNTSGNYLTAVGNNALTTNTTGQNNTALGFYALRTNSTGSSNIALGAFALEDNKGNQNTAVGHAALQRNTNGSFNVAVGFTTLFNNTTGQNNIVIGQEAMNNNTTGSANTAVGHAALYSNTANNNTAVGFEALVENISGQSNTVIGSRTGRGITTGNNNTILGANVTGLSSSLSDNIILSDGAGNIRARYSGSWTMETALKLTPQSPLPAGSVGTLAVSGSNLFYNNGISWSQIN